MRIDIGDRPLRVLCVDDEPHDRELIVEALLAEPGAFEVDEAATREECELRLRDATYDIVLSDFEIVGLEGLEVLDLAQAHAPGVPVIVVAAEGAEDCALQSKKRGAADYVIKSRQQIARLPHTIRRVLAERESVEMIFRGETRFRQLIESSPDGMVILDEHRRIRFLNGAATRLLALDRAEAIGRAFPLRIERGDEREVVLVDRLGIEHVVELRLQRTQWAGSEAELAILRDLTTQRRSVARIEHLNRVLRALGRINQLIVREGAPEQLIQQACDALTESHGYDAAWIARRRPDGTLWAAHAGWGVRFEALRTQLAGGRATPCACDARLGTGRPFVVAADEACGSCPLQPEVHRSRALACGLIHAGEDYGLLVVRLPERLAQDEEEQRLLQETATDLAFALHGAAVRCERRAAAERLRQMTEELVEAQRISKIGSWSYDVAADRPSWSPELYRFFGVSPSAPPPRWADHEALIHPEDWPRLDRAVRRTIQLGEGHHEVYRLSRRGPDGEPIWGRSIGRAERAPSGEVVLLRGTVQDITEDRGREAELEALQAQLLQAQKMESIGRLAGGVAHDFNNLLTVINTVSRLAQRGLEPDSPLRAELQQIHEAGAKAAQLTRQLLAFSRKQVMRPEVLDLNRSIAEAGKLLKRVIGEDIQLETQLAEDLPPVHADPAQLTQVILNLAVNSRDAMPMGGRLSLRTLSPDGSPWSPDDGQDLEEEPYVLLEVADSGAGMPREVQERIFEPFFTTKATGKGTGLGLATVYGIVQQSGGDIRVRSRPGEGTTFTIRLPVANEEATRRERPPAPATNDAQAVASGTILLVEDEPAVLKLTRRLLRSAGYDVVARACGEEMLALARRIGVTSTARREP